MSKEVKKGRVLAIKAQNGANIDPNSPQRVTMLVSKEEIEITGDRIEFAGEISFQKAFDFTFVPNYESKNIEDAIIDIDLNLKEGAPDLEKEHRPFIMVRSLAAVGEMIKLCMILFDGRVVSGQEPSLTEFLEVCFKDKIALVGIDFSSKENIIPISNDARLVKSAVQSYYKAQSA